MNPRSWYQIRDVLELALELPPDDRAGFLDERCAGNVALRTEVESLLEAHARGETFLERPAVQIVPRRSRGMSVEAFLEALDEPEAGKPLGAYRISRELDEGGMGTVYLAHREGNEDDLVAIKVAKLGLSPRARRRVRNEARILAGLDHPSIASILDAGTTGDGRPYLVMEYIRGTPIDVYCEEKGLSVEGRLELFIQVCAAVEAAHRRGVVHRDVKPSNILVTEEGVPKLLDFGIAKLLDPDEAAFTADATQTGEQFLTPQYASPEQIRGEAATPRSDVYSLGSLLYKLLTGRLPYLLERYTPHAMERAFENQAPPWPSEAVAESPGPTWQKYLGSDLDFIVMKAICLEPDNRYSSVELFAGDLEKYLHGEPPASDPSHQSELLKSLRARPTATSGGVIRPLHQIPPPPADFTGREADLAELYEAVAQGGVTISGLQGMGGVGKTALALKLAEMLAPRYPDAQIYLDLKGVSRKPLSPAQAMAHVVHSFRPQAPLPATEAGIAGVYRSVLHGQRALLLMDNAAGLEQVEPLVPPRGCVLLVTSRRAFSLPGLFGKRLRSLPPEDAVLLLRQIVPGLGDEAKTIADLCGYLPLALRLAGASLAERQDLSPREYTRRLSERRQRLELVEASLRLSYELLDGERPRLWRALAVFPGTFDRAAASTVWDLDPESTEDHLGELVRSGLVDWVDRRYRLHDLARLFGEHRLDQAELFAFQKRHSEHYLKVLSSAESLYLQSGEKSEIGLSLFDTEWTNIRVGQEWSQTHSGTDSSIARLCSEYPHSGSHCLWLRLAPPVRICWQERALLEARRLNDGQAQCDHLARLGCAYTFSGDPIRAIELCDESLEMALKLDDKRIEGISSGYMGFAYYSLGDLRSAIKWFEKAIEIAREIENRRLEGIHLGHLGGVLVKVGQTDRGIDLLEASLLIHRETGYRFSEGICLGNVGLAQTLIGQTRQGIEKLEMSLQIMRQVGSRQGECNGLDNLAWALLDLAEARQALELAFEGRSIARELGVQRLEGHTSASLGMSYLALGETRRGIELMERALQITRGVKDTYGEAMFGWHFGLYYEKIGRLDLASNLMQLRVDYERGIGHIDAELHAARVEEIRARLVS